MDTPPLNSFESLLHPKLPPEDPYTCDICHKSFAVPARLTRHYRTHTGEKPYSCDFCAKSFSVKENLSVHRRIHTKERPYQCSVCSRAFEHSGKLHRHMRIHTGERPHRCAVCAKTFIQSGQLVIHMRTHTGEKPYVCKTCGKGFTCSKQLKVHTRTHTGEKPYECSVCGKCFGYNHVLKLHQVAHYGEKVYKCTLCSTTFTSKKALEAHIKTHDAEDASFRPTKPASSPTSSDKENTTADSPLPRSGSMTSSSSRSMSPEVHEDSDEDRTHALPIKLPRGVRVLEEPSRATTYLYVTTTPEQHEPRPWSPAHLYNFSSTAKMREDVIQELEKWGYGVDRRGEEDPLAPMRHLLANRTGLEIRPIQQIQEPPAPSFKVLELALKKGSKAVQRDYGNNSWGEVKGRKEERGSCPRKRSSLIMEKYFSEGGQRSEVTQSPVRLSSVIHFASK